MIISCPSCASRFNVDETALTPEGRKVKCSKCEHVWVQTPEGGEPAASDEIDWEAPAEGPPKAVTAPRAGRAAPRGRKAARDSESKSSAGLLWSLFFVLLIAVGGAAYWFRADVMQRLPATEQIYAMVGLGPESPFAGLDLTDVKSNQEQTSAGTKVLRITGKVVNTSAVPRDVPELAGVLYDGANRVLHRWTFKAPEPRLLPREDIIFKTQVTNPDPKAARLTIQFSENAGKKR